MAKSAQIPLFPLSLLPLPDELVPLHIFEPRYKQLLEDAEKTNFSFGIYCNHELNKQRLGSLMTLESIVKRYPTGEADIVVRCTDVFFMDKMYRTYKTKQYPGADATMWGVNLNEMADASLYKDFLEYQAKRSISNHFSVFSLYQIACELNLDLFERYKFLLAPYEKKLVFLSGHLKFKLHLVDQEMKSKDVYHLN